jgi:transposase
MSLQQALCIPPPDAHIVSSHLAIVHTEDELIAFDSAGPIYRCRRDDPGAMRLAAVQLSQLGLAPIRDIAAAIGISRQRVHVHRKRYAEEGVAAVVGETRRPKSPHRLTEELQVEAQRLLDDGWPVSRVAKEVGVCNGTVRLAIKRGRLHLRFQPRMGRPPRNRPPAPVDCEPVVPEMPRRDEEASSPVQRAQEDQAGGQGVAVKRWLERVLAFTGNLIEAAPVFRAAEAVPSAGVLLALPWLLGQGLIDVPKGVFFRLRNGFYGLSTVFLTLAFMGLLRVRNPEQLKRLAPGEFGLLLGLDRVPEVKTLRRKLEELGLRGLASTLQQRFAERWVEAEPEQLGFLYVDGHVRVYNGRKHQLPKHHVQKRGRPMPGTQDFFVNDARAEPLFVVTAPATEGLLTMMEEHLLPEIRNLLADPTRRVTIVFDREGWSPQAFLRFRNLGFDVLSYRKGHQSTWQERFFHEVVEIVDGRKVVYRLAERRVKLSNGLPVREVRRLTDDGHQTAVITTNQQLTTFAVAHRMFSRWRQENFFRYMRHAFDLDHLCTYAVEAADPQRLVTNPERAQLDKEMKTKREQLDRVVGRRTHLKLGAKLRVEHHSLDEAQVDEWIIAREQELARLKSKCDVLPKEVPLGQILDAGQVIQLERERKTLTDLVKLVAYRAESQMTRCLAPVFKRHEDEARQLLQSIFQATADLLPDTEAGTLTVRFHGLSSPRATRALSDLCEIANSTPIRYPGTRLQLRYEAPECRVE